MTESARSTVVGPFVDWSGGFADWLRASTDEDWSAAVNHRFVRELYAERVPEPVLRRYLVQDYQFVDRFAAMLGAAVSCADTIDSRMVLGRQLGVVAGTENTYFQRAFDALEVPSADRERPDWLRPTREFNELMDAARISQNYPYCLVVLTVAEWLYLDWAAAAPEPLPAGFICREWIELHHNPEFVAWVDWLRAELDRVGPHLDELEQQACLRYWSRATALELAFFDAAYE
ncbi:thiaminase/transcriptional activator TenA [Tamaricihabitans halophyticus]|uniref:Aminopyrimidine aminohydrolase n=1 Tax=Tamaricihabitans halophyticus TaxID=1262583 RepID=A0A4R2R007_9PSEU|nr:TenA family protein [Tamaricihabitans halophyticus]TCP55297.1 thiaminase/transcriptional activator TenA [Tamaricihabitans halophyticus]